MKYVVGSARRLRAEPESAVNWREGDRVGFPARNGLGLSFRVVRGRLEEFRSHFDWEHVYARELPADVLPELESLDAEIAAAEARAATLREERQKLLLAAAQRGKHIKVKRPEGT